MRARLPHPWQQEATLLDSCGEERLRAWVNECQHNTDHLVSKAAQFSLQWSDVQSGVEESEEAELEW